MCARFGNAELAKKLIRKGAKVDVRDDLGWTPLHHDAVLSDTELLSPFLFQDRAMVDRKEKLVGATPLFLAIRRGSEKAVDILLGKGADPNICDKEDNSPLHIAARLGQHSIVQQLIRHRAKIQLCNKQKMTPLHLAATNKEAKVATLLVDQKADINAVNKDGATPLHMAAFHGSAENVKLLLHRGASVQMRTAIGHSALNLAAIASGDNGAVIEILLKAGDKVCDVEGGRPYRRST